jgi:hypothetical protein
VDDTAEMVAWMDPPGIRRPSHLLGGPGEMGDAADTEDATPMLGGGPMSLYDCECFLIQLEGAIMCMNVRPLARPGGLSPEL